MVKGAAVLRNISKLFLAVVVTGLAGLVLATLLQEAPSRRDLPVQAFAPDLTWPAVIAMPSKISEFRVLNTGSVRVPRDGVLNAEQMSEGSEVASSLWVDVFAFLFHHRERGWILIDAGLDVSFQAEGNLSGLLVERSIMGFRQKPGQNIGAQLKALKLEPSEIYFTHLHADHTAGLPELPSNIPMHTGKGESIVDFPLLFSHDHFKGVAELLEIDVAQGQALGPFDAVIDVFGDQSFWAISTPGHSDSNLSYLLMTEQGPVLMSGDASHTRYGFEQAIAPGWVDDLEAASRSLAQLAEFANLYSRTRVIFGHEE